MPYEPQPDSLAAQVVGYFRNNPDEFLTLDDITDKFQLGTGRSNIHTLLARALDSELLKREKDASGDWIYRAGASLKPVAAPVFERKEAKKTRGELDPSALVICDDPLPAGRSSPGAKYVPVFASMKPGQAIKCKPEEVTRVGHAMRKWIAQNKLPFVMRLQARYHADGLGRVWLLADPKAAQTEAAPRLKKVAG
jgi:hypothetical protein